MVVWDTQGWDGILSPSYDLLLLLQLLHGSVVDECFVPASSQVSRFSARLHFSKTRILSSFNLHAVYAARVLSCLFVSFFLFDSLLGVLSFVGGWFTSR